MKNSKRFLAIAVCLCMLCMLFAGCSNTTSADGPEDPSNTPAAQEPTPGIVQGNAPAITPEDIPSSAVEDVPSGAMSKINMYAWRYDEDDDVYWQVGIPYCANPADVSYETFGIYIPGAYMTGIKNSDGLTYTCVVNPRGQVNGYTVETAPFVMPVNTPGYSAMAAPTTYSSRLSAYTKEGLIYFYAGCRGREAGAPSAVTDMKAAIRYLRYNEGVIPGDMDSIFTFGMSGGGAQSSLMGATGDSELYIPYLESIGAIMETSDAVKGSMCWCPITSLDYADAAYEWNMGLSRSMNGMAVVISQKLASAYASYLNELGLVSEDGVVLSLSESENGYYHAGSYYDYMLSVIETSLNNFLADTEFPYTADEIGFGLPGTQNDKDEVFNTPAEYVASLNKDSEWVTYDAATKTVTVTSLEGFVAECKPATKSVGAFDDLNSTQAENIVFGDGQGNGAHFDPVLAELLKGTQYGDAYAADLNRVDALGTSLSTRVDMYNPMYFIEDYYSGCGTASVAPFWRINSGITQGDTSLNVETNLALALEAYGSDVEFTTVWGQGHIEAERVGTSSANFIAWVHACMSK